MSIFLWRAYKTWRVIFFNSYSYMYIHFHHSVNLLQPPTPVSYNTCSSQLCWLYLHIWSLMHYVCVPCKWFGIEKTQTIHHILGHIQIFNNVVSNILRSYGKLFSILYITFFFSLSFDKLDQIKLTSSKYEVKLCHNSPWYFALPQGSSDFYEKKNKLRKFTFYAWHIITCFRASTYCSRKTSLFFWGVYYTQMVSSYCVCNSYLP